MVRRADQPTSSGKLTARLQNRCWRSLLFLAAYIAVQQNAWVAASEVWVYTLISTDYDGHILMPHFINHYHELGIPYSTFYLDLLHDPAEPDTGLRACQEHLQQLGIAFSTINSEYTPALQDVTMVKSLHRLKIPVDDWVIVADTDEFYTFGYPTIQEAIAVMEIEGANYAMGETLDHVARSGKLEALRETPTLWQQFPMVCPIISEIAQGLPAKCTIHKGSLRTGAGHHHIVDPKLAKAYFGKNCRGEACELVMKTYKQRSTVDLYKLTPYFVDKQASGERGHARSDAAANTATVWSQWTKNHHFKWHKGLKDNLYHRMLRDSGDCQLGVNEQNCSPHFQFWKEVARQYIAVSMPMGFNLTDMHCMEGADTLWNW